MSIKQELIDAMNNLENQRLAVDEAMGSVDVPNPKPTAVPDSTGYPEATEDALADIYGEDCDGEPELEYDPKLPFFGWSV